MSVHLGREGAYKGQPTPQTRRARKELEEQGYRSEVPKMIDYAKWRFGFRNYRPDVIHDVMSEYDVPFSVAHEITNIALAEMGHRGFKDYLDTEREKIL